MAEATWPRDAKSSSGFAVVLRQVSESFSGPLPLYYSTPPSIATTSPSIRTLFPSSDILFLTKKPATPVTDLGSLLSAFYSGSITVFGSGSVLGSASRPVFDFDTAVGHGSDLHTKKATAEIFAIPETYSEPTPSSDEE
ncbi:hypothetical protein EVAR_93574_1 [Eumeta japonica]|uniref:Uncharacterized protein n=1 Tax=Eumeta variegata TaxID=151549 RepID=A0A4C1URI1_EUMVA|nr:hypothetical protein EVAR_93574_1 [Eumeta japonica]